MFHRRLAARDAQQRKQDALRRLQDEVAALRVHNRELSTSLGELLAQARPLFLGFGCMSRCARTNRELSCLLGGLLAQTCAGMAL